MKRVLVTAVIGDQETIRADVRNGEKGVVSRHIRSAVPASHEHAILI